VCRRHKAYDTRSKFPVQVIGTRNLVPETFANMSCILVPDLSGTRNSERIEHALLPPSYWYEILVPCSNLDAELGSCAIGLKFVRSYDIGAVLSVVVGTCPLDAVSAS